MMLSTRRSLSPRATKSRNRRMIWPARKAWSAALSTASRSMFGMFVRAVLKQPARPFHVVRDGRQRLVELVRERRGHFAHRGQSRDVQEFGLQFLQPCLGLLPFGQIANEAGEEALVARSHFADRELHRKGRAVLALADDHAADANDPPLSGPQVAFKIAVMIFAIRRRHQHLDVLADDFRGAVAEQPFRRRTE